MADQLIDGMNSPQIVYAQARVARERGDLQEALRLANAAIGMAPEMVESHLLRAAVLRELSFIAERVAGEMENARASLATAGSVPAADTPPASVAAGRLKGVNLWVRMATWLLDLVFAGAMYVLAGAVACVLLAIVMPLIGSPYDSYSLFAAIFSWSCAIAVGVVYFTLFEAVYGATPAKVLVGLHVVMDDGRPCTPGAAIIRGLLRAVELLLLGIPAAFRMRAPLHQRLGDSVAHTLVVRTADLPAERAPRRSQFLLAGALVMWLFVILAILYGVTGTGETILAALPWRGLMV